MHTYTFLDVSGFAAPFYIDVLFITEILVRYGNGSDGVDGAVKTSL
jgi:hypothetical protein